MFKPFNYIEIIKDLLKILTGQMKGKLLLKQFFKRVLQITSVFSEYVDKKALSKITINSIFLYSHLSIAYYTTSCEQ